MKSQTLFRSFLATLATTTILQAQEAAFKPGLTVGTLLNLDAGGIPPSDLSADAVPVALSDAELRLKLQFAPTLSAQTILVHENGTAAVDQAFATWQTPGLQLSFGKQTLPLGLYPSHLIHDPLLQQDLETIVPSVIATKEVGAFSGHLGFAELGREVFVTVEGTSVPEARSWPAAVAALDAKWGTDGQARLSATLGHHSRIASLGARIPAGPLAVDLEGTASDGAWVGSDFAALAGVAWKPVPVLELATRFDARKEHQDGEWEKAVGAGATLHFAEIAYTAAEWRQELEEEEGTLTLRLGIEAEFSVP